jgi:tetratricopeptide (TPR) repeat protein
VTNRFNKLELEPAQQQQHEEQQLPREQIGAAATTSSTGMQLDELHDAAHWMRMADQSRRAGAFEDALRYYSRAVELDRQMVSGWVGQVRMLIALEEYTEAELWARKALELFRNNAELHAARAQALCRNGDLKTAQIACDAAIGQQGQSPYPWMARGDLMLARKDAVAEHCFDKAIQLDPDWIILIEVAAIYMYYRRHAKALSRCVQAVERAPDQAYAWYQQGRCQMSTGLSKPARLSFKQCLDLEPKHFGARAALKELDAGEGFVKRAMRRVLGLR